MDSPALATLTPARPPSAANTATGSAADEPSQNFGDLLKQGMTTPESPESAAAAVTAAAALSEVANLHATPEEEISGMDDTGGESDLAALGLPAALFALQPPAAPPQVATGTPSLVQTPGTSLPVQKFTAADQAGRISHTASAQTEELSGLPAKSAADPDLALEKLATEKFSLTESAANGVAAGKDHTAPIQLTAGGSLLPVAQTPTPNHAPAAAQRIDVPLAQTGWADAFSQRVVWLVGHQQQTAELHVNPPDLGPIDITLSLDHDRAQITFVSTHAPVRDAIENALPRLQEALQQAGIQLGGTSVSAESFRQQNDSANLPAPGNHQAATDHTAMAQTPQPSAIVITRSGLVDIFA